MIEYMELLAVYEASNRRLLPERFKDIQVADLNERLAKCVIDWPVKVARDTPHAFTR